MGTCSWASKSRAFTTEVGQQEAALSSDPKASNQSYKIMPLCRFQVRKFEGGKGKIVFNHSEKKMKEKANAISFLNRRMLRR